MASVTTTDGVRLHWEETGSGTPLVFVHEFGGNHMSWEPQMRFFARRYRCITYAARGYPPSDVPEDVAAYTQMRAVDDLLEVMDAAGCEKAHIAGHSMGGFAALHFGRLHPQRALSLLVAGCGYGAEKEHETYFKGVSNEVARQFLAQGSERFAVTYAEGASRVQFQEKDPRGWREFADRLATHSAEGAARTMLGVQAERPSLYDFADEFAAMPVPTLVIAGDEDDHTLQPGIYLKRTIPACGLAVLPKSGHTVNLEEPALFNAQMAEFLAQVEAGRWLPRDPRARPDQVMRTS